MKNRDQEYLGLLRDYYAEHRVLPSFATLAKLLGLRTTSAVSAMVDRMKEAGYLDSGPDRRLQPAHRFFEREQPDVIRAGKPQVSFADPDLEGLNVDAYLIDKPSTTVVLTVKGDSMRDAGLLDGDQVVVKRQTPHKIGDIVVAIIDDEYTVKYLAHDKRGYYLKPANKDYEPIRPEESLEVYGVVVGSFRKYA